MPIPDYVKREGFCDNPVIEHCEYFILDDCPGTCAYSQSFSTPTEEKKKANALKKIIEDLGDGEY